MMPTRVFSTIFGGRSAAVAVAIAAMAVPTAHASTIFTSNLSTFTTPAGCTTCGATGSNFQLGYMGGAVSGITNTSPGGVLGYNFLYSSPSSANLIGAYSDSNQSIKLDSAVVADSADTQDHGYFLALDSVYEVAAIDINVNTIAGDVYTVAFDYGGTQQVGYVGTTTDFLTVGLTGTTGGPDVTPSVTVPQQGFTGWDATSFTFTANSTGLQTLSFLAGGTPTGANQEPAMTLLDNITVSQGTPIPPSMTPEPSSLLLLATGLVGLGGMMRWRMKKAGATV